MEAVNAETHAFDNALGSALERLVARYDPSVFDVGRRVARLRIESAGGSYDVVIEDGAARLTTARGGADAILAADARTWDAIAEDVRGGMTAFRSGRLKIRRDLHVGVGFLAATSQIAGPGRLRIRSVDTPIGSLSTVEAGTGDPVIMLHGLGATKASFLPTLAALAPSYHAIAVDLPGFGDSDKPLWAAYDPPFFANSMVALPDALELDRADFVGNSMGGRVALELGLAHPDRVGRLILLAPSLPWLKARPWAPYLRFVPTQLGVIQLTRSRLAAADRNIYLEEPRGPRGLWTRLPELKPEALFVWGRKDKIVPIGFERHVREEVPQSVHLELDCGHVPQLERPRETHGTMESFLATGRAGAGA
jgi:pimeloyl-ACP methyl ester carboxylesterase